MTVAEFIGKWRGVLLTERAAAQTHLIDLCRLVGHTDPVSADPTGQFFTFDRGGTTATGGKGWADVWKKGHFGFEYKGRHKDLDAAYLQLLRYQGALENPPLLVTCDTDRIVVHTHFPNTPTEVRELTLEGLADPEQLAVLRAVFHDPDRLRPAKTIQAITEEAAEKVAEIAQRLRERGVPPEQVARFLDRVVFCLFAEDVGLLPTKVFTRVAENTKTEPARFKKQAETLFQCMATGGDFGADRIEHFNGDLFSGVDALDLTADELKELQGVSLLDWTNIDASIFGTLFERALDPDKRSQLGAHYTSREDIETIVDPVVMEPLRREWDDARARYDRLVSDGRPTAKAWAEARALIRTFLGRLASVTVLDPACGSGNFLYVTLQKLKDLEKEVIIHAARHFPFFAQVGPWQLHGIEVNRYAHELAQMTVWIGHLQWHARHGMPLEERPILRPLHNFECKDAVLTLQEDTISEPEWPAAEFIVSNPPFLGVRKLRDNLGDAYVEALFTLWRGRVRPESDYCCYWFEKARAQVAAGRARRAGLLATQGIRGGASREVLKRIKESGDIFFGVSSREWVLDGANVHISMVGFDDGTQTSRSLDRLAVSTIFSDLTAALDLTLARRLAAPRAACFMADTKGGAFEVPLSTAAAWLGAPSPHGRPNSDVLRPWANGLDVTRRPRQMWIIDYPVGIPADDVAKYEAPFEHARVHVYPRRKSHRTPLLRSEWWRHERPRPEMRTALAPLSRFAATLAVAKHRVFVWIPVPTLPDHQLLVFALSDDLTLGILQSRIHELWALRKGTRHETRPRYTPTSTFETFVFPEPTDAQQSVIEVAARELDRLRSTWLNPPEWSKEESMSFPASVAGHWATFVTSPNAEGIGTATYRWSVPIDDKAAKHLKKRTLTALYNDRPTWLLDAHRALDEAVFAAYGWSPTMTDDEVLRELLALNLARSA